MKRLSIQTLMALSVLVHAGCSVNLTDLKDVSQSIREKDKQEALNQPMAKDNVLESSTAPVSPTSIPSVKAPSMPAIVEPIAPQIVVTPTPVVSIAPEPIPDVDSSSEPVASTAPVVIPSVEATPLPESPFTDLSDGEQSDVNNLFQDSLVGDVPTLEEELDVFNDLFKDNTELEDYLSSSLTTDGGPLLFTTAGFSIQMLTALPKAWKRNNRQKMAQRVRLRRIAPDRMRLVVMNQIKGDFLIDIDGTANNPSPGTKPMKERMLRHFELVRHNGKWQIDAVSLGVVFPAQPDLNILGRLAEVKVGSLNSGPIYQTTTPLKPIAKHNVPAINLGQTLRFTARVSPPQQNLLPKAFVFLHGFGHRLRMTDNGLNGDVKAADGIYSVVVTVPSQLDKPKVQVGIDVISTATMADESSDNYQSINWFTTFKVN